MLDGVEILVIVFFRFNIVRVVFRRFEYVLFFVGVFVFLFKIFCILEGIRF